MHEVFSIAIAAGYMIMIGVSYKLTYFWAQRGHYDVSEAEFFNFVLSLFWPLTLIMGAGLQLGDMAHKYNVSTAAALTYFSKHKRIAKRREREIAEAHHRVEVAKIDAEAVRLRELEAGVYSSAYENA